MLQFATFKSLLIINVSDCMRKFTFSGPYKCFALGVILIWQSLKPQEHDLIFFLRNKKVIPVEDH